MPAFVGRTFQVTKGTGFLSSGSVWLSWVPAGFWGRRPGLFLGWPLSGIAMVVIPAFPGLWIGRRFLKIDKPILIGAIAGQQCSTPAITSVTNIANSSIPMLGYTITYTLSNFLLPLTGPIFVGIIGLRT